MCGDHMELFKELAIAIGGNAALVAILAFLGKALFEKLLAKDAKLFEMSLAAKTAIANEELKRQSYEHQVRFTDFHKHMAETIAGTYERLVRYVGSATAYVQAFETKGAPSKADRREALNAAMREFREYMLTRYIYIPKPTAERIRSLDADLFKIASNFAIEVENQAGAVDAWMRIEEEIRTKGDAVALELEDEFRQLLGANVMCSPIGSPQH